MTDAVHTIFGEVDVVDIRYGDLIQSGLNNQVGAIVHGCNCMHVMKSGFAGQLVKQWPAVRDADLATKCGDRTKLGTTSVAQVKSQRHKPLLIFNAYTQYDFGRDGWIYVDYDAVYDALNSIDQQLEGQVIGMPWIGCGLANGRRDIVQDIVERIANSNQGIQNLWRIYQLPDQ